MKTDNDLLISLNTAVQNMSTQNALMEQKLDGLIEQSKIPLQQFQINADKLSVLITREPVLRTYENISWVKRFFIGLAIMVSTIVAGYFALKTFILQKW